MSLVRAQVQKQDQPSSGRIAARYVRVAGPVLHGPAGVLVAGASFAVAGAAGGRAGLAVGSG